jgi:phage tail-like protein
VSFFASDVPNATIVYDNAHALLFKIVNDAVTGMETILLDGYINANPGQYLWLQITVTPDGATYPVLRSVRLYYPRMTLTRFLPAAYSEDTSTKTFLDPFLSVFEAILSRTDETIAGFSNLFNPAACNPPIFDKSDDSIHTWLEWLSRFVSINLYDQLQLAGNRAYIQNAASFFRNKGTLDGLAELVSFLVNYLYLAGNSQGAIVCKIKEFKNNVFRSYGMEHTGENEIAGPVSYRCNPFYRKMSKTFDSNNTALLQNMNGPDDEVHYVSGQSAKNVLYANNSICIYIVLAIQDQIVSKQDLKNIIQSFLPVFVIAEVELLIQLVDNYPLAKITETYSDAVDDLRADTGSLETGLYEDAPNWNTLLSYKPILTCGTTNAIGFRTYHSGCNRWLAA